MIRIIHFIPTLEGGGAERQLIILAIEQSKKNYHVTVCVRRGGIYEEKLKKNNIEILKVGDHSGFRIKTFKKCLSIINKRKPDIIQSWLPQMDIYAGLLVRFKNIKWIMTERSQFKAYNTLGIQHCLRRFLSRKSSMIISNSELGRQNWEKVSSVEVAKIENAINISKIKSFKEDKSLARERPLIVFAGSFIKSKNIEIIIKAMSILSSDINVNLYIIGKGPLKEKLTELIIKLDLCRNVKFKPYSLDWWKYLNSANIFISMSLVEGLPNVLLEAIASETITIISDIKPHREILDKDSTFFVPAKNEFNLAATISRVLGNLDHFKYKIDNANKKISNYTIENIFNKYHKQYKNLISKG